MWVICLKNLNLPAKKNSYWSQTIMKKSFPNSIQQSKGQVFPIVKFLESTRMAQMAQKKPINSLRLPKNYTKSWPILIHLLRIKCLETFFLRRDQANTGTVTWIWTQNSWCPWVKSKTIMENKKLSKSSTFMQLKGQT